MRICVVAALLFFVGPALAHWNGDRPDGHAPISVMGDHTHGGGEWMLSYRYMGMWMEGSRDGNKRLRDADAFAAIPGVGANEMKALPTEMTMTMHMVGVMYAPADTVTFTAMLPWARREMTTRTRMVMMGNPMYDEFEVESAGIGDLGLSALVKVVDRPGLRGHLNLGLGLPTGSITEEDYMPMAGAEGQLAYGMQPGSGSLEARPGFTLLGQSAKWSWGAQVGATLALEENDQGYELGDRYQLTAWVARTLGERVSVSALLRQRWWADIAGAAEELAVSPDMNPGADPSLRAGSRLDVGLGINLLGRIGKIKGHRFAVELLAPLQQQLDGPQLETDATLVAGWQKAFGG